MGNTARLRRHEAKALEKKKRKKVVSEYEIEQSFLQMWEKRRKEEREQALVDNIEGISYVMALALIDEFGFGRKRCTKVLKRFFDDSLALESGHLNMRDIQSVVNGKGIYVK